MLRKHFRTYEVKKMKRAIPSQPLEKEYGREVLFKGSVSKCGPGNYVKHGYGELKLKKGET